MSLRNETRALVGGAVDRRRGNPDQHRAVAHAAEAGFLRAGNDANVELDARGRLCESGRALTSRLSCASRQARCRLSGCSSNISVVARPVKQDLVLALSRFLLANELERVAQRLDGRFDRGLDVAALQLEAVDLALDVLDARLCLFEQQIRPPLGLADDALRFAVGTCLDVVRQLLGR